MKNYKSPLIEIIKISADVILASGRNPIETEEDVFGFSMPRPQKEYEYVADGSEE